MKYCKYCGKQLRDSMKFCPKCGKPIEVIIEVKDEDIIDDNTIVIDDTKINDIQKNAKEENKHLNKKNSKKEKNKKKEKIILPKGENVLSNFALFFGVFGGVIGLFLGILGMFTCKHKVCKTKCLIAIFIGVVWVILFALFMLNGYFCRI